MGCFQDGVPRDLPQRVHARELNARTCVEKCKDLEFKYAGLQFSYLCFCGNTYGRYGELPQDMCSSKCTSKRDSFCGGHWSNSVYKTGKCVLLFEFPHNIALCIHEAIALFLELTVSSQFFQVITLDWFIPNQRIMTRQSILLYEPLDPMANYTYL